VDLSLPRATYVDVFRIAVVAGFRDLLQSKHLYQSVQLPQPPRWSEIAEKPANDDPNLSRAWVEYEFRERLTQTARWFIEDPAATRRSLDVSGNVEAVEALRFRPPDLKLFCTPCERVEAFNLISAEDFLQRTQHMQQKGNVGAVQLFVLSYQCQSCKGVPEAFLVRRQAARLTLSGRSPIEHVSVPNQIPKAVKRFYRGAVVAHQSGETIAGISCCGR